MNRIYHINILQNGQVIFLGMLCAMTDVDAFDPFCVEIKANPVLGARGR